MRDDTLILSYTFNSIEQPSDTYARPVSGAEAQIQSISGREKVDHEILHSSGRLEMMSRLESHCCKAY
jgi:hypothetical protein